MSNVANKHQSHICTYLGQPRDEFICVRILTCFLDQNTLLGLREVRFVGTEKATCYILEYGTGKQHRFLLHEAYVCSEPSEVQFADVDTVEGNEATTLIVPAFCVGISLSLICNDLNAYQVNQLL